MTFMRTMQEDRGCLLAALVHHQQHRRRRLLYLGASPLTLVQDEGLDEKESDSDIVILLQDSTLDAEREKDILMRVSASSTGLQVRAGC
jgi:hypothetical protein